MEVNLVDTVEKSGLTYGENFKEGCHVADA
jgi:hypothetical protein